MSRWSPRRRLLIAALAALAWALHRVGATDPGNTVNTGGWDSFRRFWAAALDPELSAEFLRLTYDAATITIAFAVLGTAVALAIGAVGAVLVAESLWPTGLGRVLRRLATVAFVVPRGVHEIVWALLLLEVFGFDPWVAILAIGVPFGAVTAKVFAETIDEADQGPYQLLRSAGAGRSVALAYGTLPGIRGELLSYAFYRLECAVRSAAVVGIIGLGGIGFQLDLSFESLRYSEIWTLIAALMLISGAADRWSTLVRRSSGPSVRNWSLAAGGVLLVYSWWRVGLSPSELWSRATRERAVDTAGEIFPPTLGPGGWSELLDATIDTAAMSIVAVVIATIGGLLLGAMAARPTGDVVRRSISGDVSRWILRGLLLLCRAVPAPLWAFVAVLILFPGPLPGAVALGVYNVGVVGRLAAEVFEERSTRSADVLRSLGATPTATLLTARLPEASGRLAALVMYRWEVIVRETIVVGVVGAGGLGELLNEHRAARDLDAVTGTVVAMIVLAAIVDVLSRIVRRQLRRSTPEHAPDDPPPPDQALSLDRLVTAA